MVEVVFVQILLQATVVIVKVDWNFNQISEKTTRISFATSLMTGRRIDLHFPALDGHPLGPSMG
jgi:hypothetical protein